MRDLEIATLPFDGLEALRLADAEGLSQEEGAKAMGVSRATFGRVVAAARNVVAQALNNGIAIRIEGGHYEVAGCDKPCPKRGLKRRQMKNGCPGNKADR